MRRRAHGFQLALGAAQLLQGSDREKTAVLAKRPEGHFRSAKTICRKDVAGIRGRRAPQLHHVEGQQLLDILAVEIAAMEGPLA